MAPRRPSVLPGLLVDVGVTLVIFIHWMVVGAVVDGMGNDEGARKGWSLWVAIFTVIVNIYTLWRSYGVLYRGDDPSDHPETILGMFAEIVSLAQCWGALFCCVRVWSLEPLHPFQSRPLLHNLGNSVFEMSLVQVRTLPLLIALDHLLTSSFCPGTGRGRLGGRGARHGRGAHRRMAGCLRWRHPRRQHVFHLARLWAARLVGEWSG